ncbi:MAG: hypothetical protein J6Y43_00230 [Clostridia bacterium]|nr:hypothetical protein [Clostridia bacterium]
MKRILCILLMLCVALTMCFAACGENNTPSDNGDNGQTTQTGDEGGEGGNTDGGDEAINVETGENETPLIPFN